MKGIYVKNFKHLLYYCQNLVIRALWHSVLIILRSPMQLLCHIIVKPNIYLYHLLNVIFNALKAPALRYFTWGFCLTILQFYKHTFNFQPIVLYTACSTIGYWHDTVVALSVHLSVTLCIVPVVDKRYVPREREQVCLPVNMIYTFQPTTSTLFPQTPHLLHHIH